MHNRTCVLKLILRFYGRLHLITFISDRQKMFGSFVCQKLIVIIPVNNDNVFLYFLKPMFSKKVNF